MIISCIITLRPAAAAAAFESLIERLYIRAVLGSLRTKIFRSSSKTSDTIAATPDSDSKKSPHIETTVVQGKTKSMMMLGGFRVEQQV